MSATFTDPNGFLRQLFDTAVAAADPMKVVANHLPERPEGRLLVVGAGKASARMAEAVEAAYGPCDGFVITRYGYARPCQQIEIVEAAHPVPDQAGVDATLQLLERVKDLEPQDTVIALISGGGSSLLCAPVAGLTLEDKQAVNAALLASGAPISEMNAVRTQLSGVKGGGLAAACAPARVISLIISDVPGDDPAEIASGPTVASQSTPQKALDILNRWSVDVPDAVMTHLKTAGSGMTPQRRQYVNGEVHIIAAPSQSLQAAAEIARAAQSEVQLLGDALEGEARDLGAAQAQAALDIRAKMTAGDAPVLLLSGGECTVTRRGQGVGGPNAEFALSALQTLEGAEGIYAIACDTDGVDGAAEVAGACIGPETLAALPNGLAVARAALADNDAHTYFEKAAAQVVTGPTLTNVNDFRAFLILPPKA